MSNALSCLSPYLDYCPNFSFAECLIIASARENVAEENCSIFSFVAGRCYRVYKECIQEFGTLHSDLCRDTQKDCYDRAWEERRFNFASFRNLHMACSSWDEGANFLISCDKLILSLPDSSLNQNLLMTRHNP